MFLGIFQYLIMVDWFWINQETCCKIVKGVIQNLSCKLLNLWTQLLQLFVTLMSSSLSWIDCLLTDSEVFILQYELNNQEE